MIGCWVSVLQGQYPLRDRDTAQPKLCSLPASVEVDCSGRLHRSEAAREGPAVEEPPPEGDARDARAATRQSDTAKAVQKLLDKSGFTEVRGGRQHRGPRTTMERNEHHSSNRGDFCFS